MTITVVPVDLYLYEGFATEEGFVKVALELDAPELDIEAEGYGESDSKPRAMAFALIKLAAQILEKHKRR